MSRTGRSRLLPVLGDGLRLALGTFTALPTPHPRLVDPARAATAICLAVLPGTLLGLAAAAVAVGAAGLGAPTAVAAVLGLAVAQVACRGLHLDGLADTADGLASGYDRQRALAVMRRSDIGPAGVAALVLVLFVQGAALTAVLDRPGPSAAAGVVAALALSRAWLVLPCLRRVPGARPEGLGAGMGRSVPVPAAVLTATLVLAGTTGGLVLLGWPGWVALLAGALPGLVVAALTWHLVRRLGGVTGDVMGAGVELALAAALVALSLA